MKTKDPPSRLNNSESFTPRVIRAFLAEESPSMMALLARALRQDERVILVGSVMFGPKTFSATSSLTPHLVVMDEHLAGVDCPEVIRRLKQLPNPPKVFIVSVGDHNGSQSGNLAAGADAVLVNASSLPRQLQAAVKTFFSHARETQSARRHFARLRPCDKGFDSGHCSFQFLMTEGTPV